MVLITARRRQEVDAGPVNNDGQTQTYDLDAFPIPRTMSIFGYPKFRTMSFFITPSPQKEGLGSILEIPIPPESHGTTLKFA